jgi:hypothetical protein
MVAVVSSEMLANFYWSIQRHVPERSPLVRTSDANSDCLVSQPDACKLYTRSWQSEMNISYHRSKVEQNNWLIGLLNWMSVCPILKWSTGLSYTNRSVGKVKHCPSNILKRHVPPPHCSPSNFPLYIEYVLIQHGIIVRTKEWAVAANKLGKENSAVCRTLHCTLWPHICTAKTSEEADAYQRRCHS